MGQDGFFALLFHGLRVCRLSVLRGIQAVGGRRV